MLGRSMLRCRGLTGSRLRNCARRGIPTAKGGEGAKGADSWSPAAFSAATRDVTTGELLATGQPHDVAVLEQERQGHTVGSTSYGSTHCSIALLTMAGAPGVRARARRARLRSQPHLRRARQRRAALPVDRARLPRHLPLPRLGAALRPLPMSKTSPVWLASLSSPGQLAEASRPKELLLGHPLALVKPAHPAPLWPKHGGPLLSTQASLSMASSISWSPRARRGAAGSPSAAATPQSRSPPRATGETGAITWPTQRWERWCPTASLG